MKGIGGLKVTSLAKWKLREVNRKTASSTSYYFRIGLATHGGEGTVLCGLKWPAGEIRLSLVFLKVR